MLSKIDSWFWRLIISNHLFSQRHHSFRIYVTFYKPNAYCTITIENLAKIRFQCRSTRLSHMWFISGCTHMRMLHIIRSIFLKTSIASERALWWDRLRWEATVVKVNDWHDVKWIGIYLFRLLTQFLKFRLQILRLNIS